MRDKNNLFKLWSILGCILFLIFMPNIVSAQQQSPSTGGLSRVRVDNTVIEVEGGFIRSLRGNEVFIWMQSLSAQINLSPWDKTSTGNPQALNFIIANTYPPRVKIEGVEDFQSHAKGIKFQLTLEPGQRKHIKLNQTWDEDHFQFVVMGDNRDNPEVFSRILRQGNQHKPLFFVNCGDLVSNGGRKEYYEFLKSIQDAHYPFFFALGNHDIFRQGKRIFNELFGPDYYSFRFRNSHFIFLDNALGRLSENQYNWLEQALAKSTSLYKFIFMHMPPFDPREGKHDSMDLSLNAQWFLDLVEKYKVDIVFTSHIHDALEAEKNGTKYIITGGGGAPLDDKDYFFHYVLVTVTPDGIKTDVVKVP